MSNLLAAIRTRQSAVRNVHIEVKGAVADLPARFSAVDLAITADAPDREELDRLIEIADRGCIMMNTLRDKLTLNIVVCNDWPDCAAVTFCSSVANNYTTTNARRPRRIVGKVVGLDSKFRRRNDENLERVLY